MAQIDETTIDTSSGEVLDDVVLKAPAGSTVVTPTTTIMEEAGISAERPKPSHFVCGSELVLIRLWPTVIRHWL